MWVKFGVKWWEELVVEIEVVVIVELVLVVLNEICVWFCVRVDIGYEIIDDVGKREKVGVFFELV